MSYNKHSMKEFAIFGTYFNLTLNFTVLVSNGEALLVDVAVKTAVRTL